MVVFLLTTPSVSAASAVTSLMVEHGTNPVLRASFWLTMLRMRPFDGIHHDHAAREGSQGGDGGAADDEIVAIDVIAHGGVHAGNFGFIGKLLLDCAAAFSSAAAA